MTQGTLRKLLSHARPVGLAARLLAAATFIGLVLLGVGGNSHPVAAQQAERVAVVRDFLDAWSRHDVDAAVSAFADDAVFIAARETGPCASQTPCTGLEGTRQQIEFAVGLNICQTLRDVYVSGSVVHGRFETRTNVDRGNGVERLLRVFIADIPNDKIIFFAVRNDLSDPQTSGTQRAAAPLPNPATPCAGVE